MLRLPALCCGLLVALPAFAAAQIEPLPNPIQVPGVPWCFDGFIAGPGTKLADYTTEILTPKGLLCARPVARFEVPTKSH